MPDSPKKSKKKKKLANLKSPYDDERISSNFSGTPIGSISGKNRKKGFVSVTRKYSPDLPDLTTEVRFDSRLEKWKKSNRSNRNSIKG